jgi:hypothetical protein
MKKLRTTRTDGSSILRKVLVGALVTTAAFAPSVRGQGPAPDAPPRTYTRDKHFNLPVALDDRERLTLQEVQLYVKAAPQEPWRLAARGSARQTGFDYRVPGDGEYAFGIATLDRNGQLMPADVPTMIPGLIVVVDTRPPDVTVRLLPSGPQGDLVECRVVDANPSPDKVRVEYQVQGLPWQVLQPLAENAERYRLPGPIMPTSLLRVWAADRAGNATTRIVKLGMPEPGLPANPQVTFDTRSAKVPAGPGVTEQRGDGVPRPAVTEQRGVVPADFHYAPTPLPLPADLRSGAGAAAAPSRADLQSPPPLAASPPAKTQARSAAQLLNGTHVTLEYKIEKQGPTGVGKVEVWATQDDGASWRRLHEDPGRGNLLQFDLPGEGIYGLSLVMTNGHGVASPPPRAGDAPDYWVEVDLTKPAAQLLSARAGTGTEVGSLLITWLAQDKNLGETPIDLYYANQRDGPWQPVARGLRNDGSHRWTLPQDAGAEFFIRMDVTDRAGNLTRCLSPEPVMIDLVRPKARVVGITASIAGTAP